MVAELCRHADISKLKAIIWLQSGSLEGLSYLHVW